jgi:hypothetical protein
MAASFNTTGKTAVVTGGGSGSLQGTPAIKENAHHSYQVSTSHSLNCSSPKAATLSSQISVSGPKQKTTLTNSPLRRVPFSKEPM